MTRVLTVSTQFAGLGGAEAILRGHHDHDAAYGIDSRFTIFWEPQQEGWPHTRFLDLQINQSVRSARARFAAAHPGFHPDIAVYHTDWGWPYFADLDRASRRVLYLHSDFPGLERQLASRVHWLDGVICVSTKLRDRVLEYAPDLGSERCLVVEASISPPNLPEIQPTPAVSPDRPWVLGYCGRVVREQKRVDRIPPLLALLDRTGLPYRLEILGEGEDREWLLSQLPKESQNQVRYLGKQSGSAYWHTLAGWDAIVFLSDYEGTPIALLEALSQGVLPLHPALDSGGDRLAASVDPHCIYPVGDLEQLTNRVVWLARQSAESRLALQLKAQAAVSPHLGETYRTRFAAFIQHILRLPERTKQPLPRRPFPLDWMSFRTLETLGKWRRKWRNTRH